MIFIFTQTEVDIYQITFKILSIHLPWALIHFRLVMAFSVHFFDGMLMTINLLIEKSIILELQYVEIPETSLDI